MCSEYRSCRHNTNMMHFEVTHITCFSVSSIFTTHTVWCDSLLITIHINHSVVIKWYDSLLFTMNINHICVDYSYSITIIYIDSEYKWIISFDTSFESHHLIHHLLLLQCVAVCCSVLQCAAECSITSFDNIDMMHFEVNHITWSTFMTHTSSRL